MEILSPAKNLDTIKVAVQSGCDAVYIGSPSFSARNKVNIDIEELKEIISYTNSYKVSSYIAFNTVIFEDEIQNLLDEVVTIYNLGATGIILQDFSLAKLIKPVCPELEIHASTQMNINNSYGVKLIKDFNFNRVVVPREMKFDQIRFIKDKCDIDIEVFIHGAICVSYSGQCYDSVLLDQKSANRGRCSQYCRFEQSVYKNDRKINDLKFALNIKDMNNSELIEEYKKSGADSLKIEGRLKNIDYIGVTASSYKNNEFNKYQLEQVYNRTFTNGLINNTKSKDLVNNKRINNNGYYIGSIIKKEKSDVGYYKYKYHIDTSNLTVNDNIRFLKDGSELGQRIDKVENLNDESIFYSKLELSLNTEVYKTFDSNVFKYYDELKKSYNRRLTIPINISIYFGYITYTLFDDTYTLYFDAQFANKKALSEEYLISNLVKTKNTPYDLDVKVDYLEEQLYFSNKELKALKREIIERVFEVNNISRNSNKITYTSNKIFEPLQSTYFVEVHTEEQLKLIKNYECEIIIGSFSLIDKIDIKDSYILKLPSVIYDDQVDIIDNYVSKFNRLLVSELGMYYKFKDSHNIITNYTLNSTNNFNISNLDADYNILSLELNKERINSMSNTNSMIMIYGYIPVMIMDYCPINLNKNNGCNGCNLCHNHDYYLKDFTGSEFPLMHNDIDKLTMYSDRPVYLKKYLSEININHYYIKFSIENKDEVESVLSSIFEDKKPSFDYYDHIIKKEVL